MSRRLEEIQRALLEGAITPRREQAQRAQDDASKAALASLSNMQPSEALQIRKEQINAASEAEIEVTALSQLANFVTTHFNELVGRLTQHGISFEEVDQLLGEPENRSKLLFDPNTKLVVRGVVVGDSKLSDKERDLLIHVQETETPATEIGRKAWPASKRPMFSRLVEGINQKLHSIVGQDVVQKGEVGYSRHGLDVLGQADVRVSTVPKISDLLSQNEISPNDIADVFGLKYSQVNRLARHLVREHAFMPGRDVIIKSGHGGVAVMFTPVGLVRFEKGMEGLDISKDKIPTQVLTEAVGKVPYPDSPKQRDTESDPKSLLKTSEVSKKVKIPDNTLVRMAKAGVFIEGSEFVRGRYFKFTPQGIASAELVAKAAKKTGLRKISEVFARKVLNRFETVAPPIDEKSIVFDSGTPKSVKPGDGYYSHHLRDELAERGVYVKVREIAEMEGKGILRLGEHFSITEGNTRVYNESALVVIEQFSKQQPEAGQKKNLAELSDNHILAVEQILVDRLHTCLADIERELGKSFGIDQEVKKRLLELHKLTANIYLVPPGADKVTINKAANGLRDTAVEVVRSMANIIDWQNETRFRDYPGFQWVFEMVVESIKAKNTDILLRSFVEAIKDRPKIVPDRVHGTTDGFDYVSRRQGPFGTK